IAAELKGAAMELVASGFGCRIDLCNGSPVLGTKNPRFDLEFLQRIDRWQEHVRVEVQIGVLDAIQRIVVEMNSLARNVQRKAVALTSHALLALARGRPVGRGSRNQ